MTGAADWAELIFITTLAVAVGGIVWWFGEHLRRQRHEMRSFYEQRLTVMQEHFEEIEQALDKRIHQLELFDAALNVILKQVDDFRDEVKVRFDGLRAERKEDMRELHKRLDAIMHHQIDRDNRETMRPSS